MDIKNDKFIILEIIPTNSRYNGGEIVQLSALKIEKLKLQERFDYRIKEENLSVPQIIDFINYDNEQFKYVDDDKEILKNFKDFASGYTLLFLDNIYTPSFFEDFDNSQKQILDYLDLDYSKEVINEIMKKYNIKPTNHIVDILYEALLMKY